MKAILNTILALAGLIVTAGFALLIVGLGYFFMSIALNFGWAAVIGLIVFIGLIGFIEGTIWTLLTAPFVLIAGIFQTKEPRAPSDAEKTTSQLVSLTLGLLMVVGAIVATLQFIVQGGAG